MGGKKEGHVVVGHGRRGESVAGCSSFDLYWTAG